MRPTLPVIFRKKRGKQYEGEITAVFPTVPGTNDLWTMTCYAHIGQHGSCSWGWYRSTIPAKPEDYKDLLAELRSIYEREPDAVTLVVRHRMCAAYRRARLAELRRMA